MDSQKFEYFMERTEDDLKHIRERVDTLWDYRVLQIGGSIVVSALSSGIVVALYIYFGIH